MMRSRLLLDRLYLDNLLLAAQEGIITNAILVCGVNFFVFVFCFIHDYGSSSRALKIEKRLLIAVQEKNQDSFERHKGVIEVVLRDAMLTVPFLNV